MASSLVVFDESVIYLDTIMLYVFLRAEPQVRPILKGFFESVEQGRIAAYTSALTFDELAYRLLLAVIHDKYPGSPLDRLRAEEAALLSEFSPIIAPSLRLLRQLPNLRVLDVTAGDVDVMLDLMPRYALRPRDALHVVAMQKVGCEAIASNDPHFDRVPHLRRFEVVV